MFSIVIADDEALMRKALETFVPWNDLDCSLVTVCKDGREALDALALHAPDILICDISMPNVSGIDVAKHIFEHNLPTQVILLTAYADFSYAQQALRYGVVDYVVKNGVLENLQVALKKCFERIEKDSRLSSSDVPLFLSSLVNGTIYKQSEINSFRKDHALFKSMYLLMTVERRGAASGKGPHFQEVQDSISKWMNSFFKERSMSVESFPVGRDKLCLFIPDCSLDYAFKAGESFLEVLQDMLSMSATIGISNAGRDLASLPDLYKQTMEAIAVGFYEEARNLFLVPANAAPSTRLSSTSYVSSLERALLLQDTDAVKEVLDAFFLEIRSRRVAVQEVRRIGLMMLSSCRKALESQGIEHSLKAYDDMLASAFPCSNFETSLREGVDQTISLCALHEQEQYDLVLVVRRFIEANYRKSISLADIAEVVHHNPSYLSRVFKQKTGVTVTNEINQKKVEVAAKLLENNNLKTYEIADYVGFEDAAYFSNIFRKYMGVTPSQYRAKVRKEE